MRTAFARAGNNFKSSLMSGSAISFSNFSSARHTSIRITRAVKPSVSGCTGTMRLTWMNSSSPGSTNSVSGCVNVRGFFASSSLPKIKNSRPTAYQPGIHGCACHQRQCSSAVPSSNTHSNIARVPFLKRLTPAATIFPRTVAGSSGFNSRMERNFLRSS